MPRGNTTIRPKKEPHLDRKAYVNPQKAPIPPGFCTVISGDSKPWLTLVIGSGCATSPTQESALFRMAQRLENCKSGQGLPGTIGDELPTAIEGEPIGAAVASFAATLIRDRLRLSEPKRNQDAQGASDRKHGAGEDAAVPGWLFRLFTVAVFSTRLYYRIKSLTAEAPRRPDREDHAVLDPRSRSGHAVNEDLVTPCCQVLDALSTEISAIVSDLTYKKDAGLEPPEAEPEFEKTVADILSRTDPRKAGGPVRVSLTDLQAFTEFAWFCITKIATPKVYPGWSDLLLDLSNYDSHSAGSIDSPRFSTMMHAQSLIRSRYAEVTRESWASIWKTGGERKDDPHYRTAAELLQAQHEFRKRVPIDWAFPPLTTAFVTSFDLELELSLLYLKQEFTVALPVHVLNTQNNVAHTCWVALRVPVAPEGQATNEAREARLACLTTPEADRWFLLDEEVGAQGPVVVRLAGCPLIRLPAFVKLPDRPTEDTRPRIQKDLTRFVERFLKMDAKGNDEALKKISRNLEWQHAVVINEHDAILQSAIDLIEIPDGNSVFGYYIDDIASGEGGHRGLPARFVAGERDWSRFWMLLGVQIHDTAVRHRLTTLISSLPIPIEVGRHVPPKEPREGGGTTHGGDSLQATSAQAAADVVRSGVAVNKHLTALEQDLLLWNGFDIVSADVSEFAPDLLHYVDHLKKDRTDFPKGSCNLP